MSELLQRLWGEIAAFLLSPGMSRAKFFVDMFSQYLNSGDSLLDLGCGPGHLGVYANRRYGQKVTFVDVKSPWGYIGQWLLSGPSAKTLARRHNLPYVLYDGSDLSAFTDGTFDTVLIAFALHHADDPDAVLAEAVRVAGKRVIVLEDIPANEREAWVNHYVDALVNLEISGHPHSNRTRAEWEQAFLSLGLKLVSVRSFYSSLYFFLRMPNTIFVLKKQAS
jgi:ubiquinone/menaquinone biosynthesis C-methylase UbiE